MSRNTPSSYLSTANTSQLTEECLFMHQLLKNRISKLRQLKDNELCYILSTKWFQAWKDYVAYDQLTSEQVGKTTKKKCSRNPGKINADIIAPQGQKKKYYSIPSQLTEYQYLNELTDQKKLKDEDFIPVSQDIWLAFLMYYEGQPIRRTVKITKSDIFYDGGLLKCQVIFANLQEEIQEKIKKTAKKNLKSIFSNEKIMLSAFWTLKQLIDFFSRYCKAVYNNNSIRIWKGFTHISTNQIAQSLVDSIKNGQFVIKGRQLKEEHYNDHLIEEFLKSTHTIIVEIGQKCSTDLHQGEQLNGYCEQCGQKKQLTIGCVCDEVVYCTRKCRTIDQIFHYQTCSKAFDSQDDEDYMNLNIDQVPMAGLDNIGNSCYSNSIMQALISLNHIRSFFSTNQYRKHCNQKDLKENNCMFLNKLSKTIKALFQAEDSYAPWPLKGQIDYNISPFRGDKQHDANDFLINFLNAINDCLHQSDSKAYHKVIQPFIGEFHSKVICPHCKTISQNNEIFLQINLPIKSKAPLKTYQYAVVQSLQQIRRGKSSQLESWQQIKKEIDAKQSLICIARQPMGLVILNEQEDTPEKIFKTLKGDLLFYKTISIEEGLNSFIFSLVTIKTVVGTKMKSTYGVPIIISLCDQQTTLGTFWLLIIKTYFNRSSQIVAQAQLIEKQYFTQIESSIKYQSKVALQTQTQQIQIAEDIESQRCKKIVQNYNKKLKFFAQKLGIEVYINDFKRKGNICSFCKKRCSNCDLPKLFDEPFDGFFSQKYNEIKFEVFLREYLQIEYKNQQKCASGDPNIQDCLQLFAQPQQLDQQNAYYCDKCDSMGLALKQLHVKTFPLILILHLNRFKSVQGKKIKNNDPIQYSQTQNFEGKQYGLIAAIIHEGSMQTGHYWCISKRKGLYYSFNDSKVSKIEKVFHRNAYILIYQLLSQ